MSYADNSVDGVLEPLSDAILVTDIESGDSQTKTGIWIPDDDQTERGIRPRWATVYNVGNEIDYLQKGQRILIDHGRWSRGVKDRDGKTVRLVDNKDILALEE